MIVLKYSVIVPVYNTEKYLDRCISSIVSQNFDDYELILVDDGSPDACPCYVIVGLKEMSILK